MCSVEKLFLETLAHLFYCEFCEISKNTYYRLPLVAASAPS